jgi:hypothetical protein
MTTIDDLREWDRNFYTRQVGGDGVIRRMVEPPDSGSGPQYAGGLYLSTGWHGIERTVHNGATAGFRAEMVRFPAYRLAVAVLCNAEEIPASDLAHSVAEIYLGLVSEMGATAEAAPDAEFQPPASPVPGIAGTYAERGGDSYLEMAVVGNRMRVTVERADTAYLNATAGREARYGITDGQATLELHGDAGGVDRVVWTSPNGRVRAFERVPPLRAAKRAALAGPYRSLDLNRIYWITDEQDQLFIRLDNPEGRRLVPGPLLSLGNGALAMEDGYSILRFDDGDGAPPGGFVLETRRGIRLPFERVGGAP